MQSPIPSLLFLPLAASLVLSWVPGGKYALYPFRLFTTWVHECCHALMALALGGTVHWITLATDTSGLTSYKIRAGRLRESLVASAGYMGSSALGCVLFYLSFASHLPIQTLTILTGALIALSLLFWIRNLFGALVAMILSIALISQGLLGRATHSRQLLIFMAIQTGLNALFDIRVLFSLDPRSTSDARTLQKIFWLPAGFWALLWLILSGLMMGATVYWTSHTL